MVFLFFYSLLLVGGFVERFCHKQSSNFERFLTIAAFSSRNPKRIFFSSLEYGVGGNVNGMETKKKRNREYFIFLVPPINTIYGTCISNACRSLMYFINISRDGVQCLVVGKERQWMASQRTMSIHHSINNEVAVDK